MTISHGIRADLIAGLHGPGTLPHLTCATAVQQRVVPPPECSWRGPLLAAASLGPGPSLPAVPLQRAQEAAVVHLPALWKCSFLARDAPYEPYPSRSHLPHAVQAAHCKPSQSEGLFQHMLAAAHVKVHCYNKMHQSAPWWADLQWFTLHWLSYPLSQYI